LLAEDNRTNQFVLVQLLRGFDLAIDIFPDGEAALEGARVTAYDVAFMDMRMPRMDGLQATRAIRALPAPNGTLPIIALTANAFPDDMAACRAAGMTQFVAKPLRKERLLGALAEAFTGKAEDRKPWRVYPAAPSAGSAGEEEPAIAPSVLEVLETTLGRETVLRMVEIFRTETEARLRDFAAGMSAPALREEMHALKGTAATVGAPRLSALAARAEARLNKGAPPSVAPETFQQAFHDYLAGLEALGLAPSLAA
jgi:CheY-like chemotaxis protein/HPt (histidine-containing phosphotransfer) domain-containing protein